MDKVPLFHLNWNIFGIFIYAIHIKLENKPLEIIKSLVESKRLYVTELSAQTGIPKDRIYKWLRGDGSPKVQDQHILEQWVDNVESSNLSKPKVPFMEQRRISKQNKSSLVAPFIPVKAQAGYTKAIDQEVYADALEKYGLPPCVDPMGAFWRYWEIEGDSMEPEFKSGEVILTSQVPKVDWDSLRDYYAYIIVTKDQVLFKRVYPKSKTPGNWVLISANEKMYEQQLQPIDDVREVWVFRRLIRDAAPPHKRYEINL